MLCLPNCDMSDQAAALYPALAKLYRAVVKDGRPNYRGARICVPSHLRISAWRHRIPRDYLDRKIIELVAYGFPVGYEGDVPPQDFPDSYNTATDYPHAVATYIRKELAMRALAGPFSAPPFIPWVRCSPLMTRPKKDPGSRRVIQDMRAGESCGLNNYIPRDHLDGIIQNLWLPMPWTYAAHIVRAGPRCLICKGDLLQAHRQLIGDPLDWPLLGMYWRGDWYWDRAVPFGLPWGVVCETI